MASVCVYKFSPFTCPAKSSSGSFLQPAPNSPSFKEDTRWWSERLLQQTCYCCCIKTLAPVDRWSMVILSSYFSQGFRVFCKEHNWSISRLAKKTPLAICSGNPLANSQTYTFFQAHVVIGIYWFHIGFHLLVYWLDLHFNSREM